MSIFFTGRILSPCLEHLIGRLEWLRCEADRFNARPNNTEEQKAIIERCHQRLTAAKEALNPPHFWSRRRIFGAWDIVHQVDGDFMLLMTKPELLAVGHQMRGDLKNSSISEILKNNWQPKIDQLLQELQEDKPAVTAQDIVDQSRYVFRNLADIINSNMDLRFWEIWCTKFFSLLYCLELLSMLSILAWMACTKTQLTIGIPMAIFIGAIGGLGSGIITLAPVNIPYGHFWPSFWYLSTIRMVQGGVAALMVLWLLQGGYLISIEPRLDRCTPIFTCTSSGKAAFSQYLTNRNARLAKVKTTSPSDPVVNPDDRSIIHFKSTIWQAPYLYLLILLIAGFSGDKLLRQVTSKLFEKMFADAEKTKEAK